MFVCLLFFKVFVEDPTLRSKWNKKQSVQKNFKRLGIASDPNEAIMRKATSNSNLVQSKFYFLFFFFPFFF